MPRSTTGKGDPASEEMGIEMADLPSHDAQTEESPVHSEIAHKAIEDTSQGPLRVVETNSRRSASTGNAVSSASKHPDVPPSKASTAEVVVDTDSQASLVTPMYEDIRLEARARAEEAFQAACEDAASIPKPAIWDEEHEYVYLEKPQLGPWETIQKGLHKYDKEMCDAWNDELNTILTFTGLFSAAVTAFCVGSFQTLSQNPADTTNMFLIAISQQLANSSSPVADFSMVNKFTPNNYDVQINVLYFVSLAFALSVSSACILGKQWIREYQKDIAVSPYDSARVRQMRYDSFQVWKVPQIMAALPVTLLVALMLFFAGLLVQLWHINDHTTAAAVSVIVALTALLVIITTVVPACVSTQPSRSAFAPFRSPQAWIFFYVFRRLQHWCRPHHDPPWSGTDTRRNWKDKYPIQSSWAEFDLHFLQIEKGGWFEHKVCSVHRVLRWVRGVLRNSSEMEKSLLWCLQAKFHPENLIQSKDDLTRYVMIISNGAGVSDSLDRVYYDYSQQNQGGTGIDSPIGRHQAESLIRSGHRAADDAWGDREKAWDIINHSCDKLWYCRIFNEYSDQDMVKHQHIVQDQVALFLERLFSIPPPSHSFKWSDIICLLLIARHESSSLCSRQILHDVLSQRLLAWIKSHKSASLLYGIGYATFNMSPLSWEHAIELFTRLDEVMVEMCYEPEGIEGLDEGSVERWRELRTDFTAKTRGWPGVLRDSLFERAVTA